MAIGTYGQLKTAVANWLHRTDLTSVIPDFIALAESIIRHDVRCRAMEQSATGTLTTNTVATPTRFAQARRVLLGGYVQEYVSPQTWDLLESSSSGHYTILGSNFLFQSTSADYQIDYWQWFAPFTDDGDTNWLLTNHPDIYLFAALIEASDHVAGDRSRWQPRYAEAVQKLRTSEWRYTGPLSVRPNLASVV